MSDKKNKIAIVGMACRLPGGITTPDKYWDILKKGDDVVTEIGSDRWGTDYYLHRDRTIEGKSVTFSAGVLDQVDQFDASFFGISPREAVQMDPQQRLLLELTWESLENAHYKPEQVEGTDTAVYIGIASTDYVHRRVDDLSSMDAYSMTGNTASIASNRISYAFDFQGPSVSIDTACSSSLVALHQACNAINNGEASMAVTGGINMLLHPFAFVGFSKASMLSAHGCCRAFDAKGDGYVRSEGAAIFILKPLLQAEREGDRIHGVIVASGVNCDGKTKGITVPSSESQANLLASIYNKAAIDPNDITYLEAHGTGTPVGDPREASAIGEVLGRKRTQPLPIGSSKTNLGHLETASGMAGLLKALLIIREKALPKTVHFEEANPAIDFEKLQLHVVDQYTPLAKQEKALLIGVNSFGFGGANAHIVLEEYKTKTASVCLIDSIKTPPLYISARSDKALKALAGNYVDYLKATITRYYDIAWTSYKKRQWHSHRLAIYADTTDRIIEQLVSFSQSDNQDEVVSITINDTHTLRSLTQPLALVFTGNGSQWQGMGKVLLQQSPLFRQAIAEMDVLFAAYGSLSLIEEFNRDLSESRLSDTSVAQPLLFALQVGLMRVMQAEGLQFQAVVGHSVGEVAAAWAAGILTLEQAVHVIFERSAAQDKTRGQGRMAAVNLSYDAVNEKLIALSLHDTIEIAGINSHQDCTLSGSLDDLQLLADHLADSRVFYRILDLDYAFHSTYMDGIKEDIINGLATLSPHDRKLLYVSTVTGKPIEGKQLDATYWWNNIRQPVQFSSAIDYLLDEGFTTFIEVGPHPILRTYLKQAARNKNSSITQLATLFRKKESLKLLTDTVHQSILLGCQFDESIFFPQQGTAIELPPYAWQRERYWYSVTNEGYNLVNRHRVHPLLGYRLNNNDTIWENHIDGVIEAWLTGHIIDGGVILPASAYVEMALAAVNQISNEQTKALENLDILAPMVLDKIKITRFVLEQKGYFRVFSKDRLSDDDWTLNAKGRLLHEVYHQPQKRVHIEAHTCDKIITSQDHYQLAHRVGLDYGKSFQTINNVWVKGVHGTAQLTIPALINDDYFNYHLHPAILDGCFQVLVDFFSEAIESGKSHALIPVQVGSLFFYGHHGQYANHLTAWIVQQSPRSVLAHFTVFNQNNEVIADVLNVRFRRVKLTARYNHEPSCYQFQPWLLNAISDPFVWCDSKRLVRDIQHSLLPLSAKRQHFYQELMPLMGLMASVYVFNAFNEVSQDKIIDLSLIDNNFQLFVKHWLAYFETDQLASPIINPSATEKPADITQWQLHTPAESVAPNDIWLGLLADTPALLPELLLISRCGEHLAAMIQGQYPVEEGITHASLHTYNQWLGNSETYRYAQQAVSHTVQSMVSQQGAEQRLSILELGLGNRDSLSQRLSSLMIEKTSYLVLSDNKDWLAEVATLQEHYPCLSVESDDHPITHDTYDLMIINHATLSFNSIPSTLDQYLPYLKTNGRLVIMDTPTNLVNELITGVFSNTWMVDEQNHTLSLYYSSDEWKQLLSEHKLEDIAILQEADDMTSEGAFLMTAVKGATPEKQIAESPIANTLDTSILCFVDESFLDKNDASLEKHINIALQQQLQQQSITFLQVNYPASKEAFLHYWSHLIEQTLLPEHIVCFDFSQTNPLEVDDTFVHRLLYCIQAMHELAIERPITLVTHNGTTVDCQALHDRLTNPAQSASWGLARVLMNEHSELSIRLIDLQDSSAQNNPTITYNLVKQLSTLLIEPIEETEIILTPSARYASRMKKVSLEKPSLATGCELMVLDFKSPGPLKNLYWKTLPKQDLLSNEIEIRPYAAGLNFRDVMYAMGLLSDEAVENGFAGSTLGMELSGQVVAIGDAVDEFKVGDDVIGFAPACFSTRVITLTTAIAHKPDSWCYEEAATVPTTFFTVYYALHHLAHLEAGEKILIHGAAGGVGIAAIQYARSVGAEIFATAGTEEKRDFVRMMGADHVMDSRTLEFAEQIHQITDNQGVDVVLNSLAGEAVNRNLSILKPFGRFLELGKRDYYENNQMPLRPFRNNITYYGIDADQLLIEKPALAGRLFREMMALFKSGQLIPLPYRVFRATHIQDAFRYMQQSRQIGKVIVSFEGDLPLAEKVASSLEALTFKADASYLITGGLSGLGLKTALWMAKKGAGELLLVSRSGCIKERDQALFDQLNETGCTIHPIACDISDESAVHHLFTNVSAYLPIKGMLHAAMVIDDGLAKDLTKEVITQVLRPKVAGAWNLHQASINKTYSLSLDYFIMYSSVTTYLGNPGQANYVAANSFLEGLAFYRQQQGLPATFAAWGAIDDVGFLTYNKKTKEALQTRLGGQALTSNQALAILEKLIISQQSGVAVINFDWNAISRLMPSAKSLKYTEQLNHVLSNDSDEYDDIQAMIQTMNEADANAFVVNLLLDEIGHILRLSKENLDANKSVIDLGMDSLMGMELALAVEERFGVKLPVMVLTEGASVSRIAERIIDQLQGSDAVGSVMDEKIKQAVSQHASDMSEHETDQLKANLLN